ncbi:MAG: chemotaxis protein CheB [Janthinobacterium lividum]
MLIGASAGGVEVLANLLPAIGHGFPAAVVIVLHLPAHGRSELPELFAPRCAVPVLEASDKEPLRAGNIYFAPPGYHLLIETAEQCALSTDAPVNFSRPSIDVLFESGAWVHHERTLGVLLTGASTDGALGLKTIREAGGTTWAQAPETARASMMPLSAIELGVVDEVLSIEQMALRFAQATGRTSQAEE